MDTKTLIKNLNQLFCDENKAGNRFSEVWLSEVDFGGIYQSDRFVLNVKTDRDIDNCGEEIRDIVTLLDEKAKDELLHIWSVKIYDSHDRIHCESGELMVFEESNACE